MTNIAYIVLQYFPYEDCYATPEEPLPVYADRKVAEAAAAKLRGALTHSTPERYGEVVPINLGSLR